MVMPQWKPIFQFILQLTSNQVIESINVIVLINKDRSGSSVGISADGKKIIIGALCNDGDTDSNGDCRGHAIVYEYLE